MVQPSPIPDIAVVAARARAAGISQEEIADVLGASQSQVSRILAGKSSKRPSRLYMDICKYVYSRIAGVSPELVRENEELVAALADVWDGTPNQSAVLAGIIRSLGPLCATPNPPAKRTRRINK